jgi:hypothetical protein
MKQSPIKVIKEAAMTGRKSHSSQSSQFQIQHFD